MAAFNAANRWLGWIGGVIGFVVVAIVLAFGLFPLVASGLGAITGPLGRDVIGITTEHYEAVWLDRGFTRNFLNSMMVTAWNETRLLEFIF